MSKLMLVPIVALLTTTACAADLSGDDDGAIASPDPAPVQPEPLPTACETAAPDGSFVGSPMILGIVPDGGEAMLELDAHVDVQAPGDRFSIEIQPLDPDTGASMGEPQHMDDVVIDADGLFTIEELVLSLPPGSFALAAHGTSSEGQPGPEVGEGQTALAEVRGGFCTHTGSLQGVYEGWTFTPTAEVATGVWFVAPLETL